MDAIAEFLGLGAGATFDQVMARITSANRPKVAELLSLEPDISPAELERVLRDLAFGSGSAARSARITAARGRYRREVATGRTVLCDERACVNQCLRDAGLRTLGERELEASDPVRAPLITAARAKLRAENAAGRTVLCSERAYIDQHLRDAGKSTMDEREARRFGVA